MKTMYDVYMEFRELLEEEASSNNDAQWLDLMSQQSTDFGESPENPAWIKMLKKFYPGLLEKKTTHSGRETEWITVLGTYYPTLDSIPYPLKRGAIKVLTVK